MKEQLDLNSTLLLKGGRILTFDEHNSIYDPGYILIENDKIIDCGPLDELNKAIELNSKVVELWNQLIMPGLINSHTHTCMSILRGVAEDVPKGKWLEDKILPIENGLSGEDYYWSSRLGCLELIRNGVTCIADRGPYIEHVTKAVEESGIRAVISLTITDKLGIDGLNRQLKLSKDFKGSSRITYGLGPHATDTCSTELLQEIKKASIENNMRIFIHVAQSEAENEVIKERGYNSAVEYLNEIKFLDTNVIAAHCIYVNDDDVQRLARTGAWIAHCPSSNIKIEAKTTPLVELKELGANITIATDAAACNNRMDLFEEMKVAALAHKLLSKEPTNMSLDELIPTVTGQPAAALGMQDSIGSIKTGKKADIISIDIEKPHLNPWNNDLAQLVYSVRGNDVSNVLIDGIFRLRNGEFVDGKDKEIIDEIRMRTSNCHL